MSPPEEMSGSGEREFGREMFQGSVRNCYSILTILEFSTELEDVKYILNYMPIESI